MSKRIAIFSLFVLALCGWAGPAAAYDVYKLGQDGNDVPDVNKVDPTDPTDQSCWTATAANLLAGAGWGMPGNTSQQNADAIYGQLTNHFGLLWPGYEERAINWWLVNYGHNPDALDANYYNPLGTYTDVTHVNKTLLMADYDFLLDEANRCQYVAVSFQKPETDVGHVMTLIGGNYSPLRPPVGQQVSVWHDSDDGISGDVAHNNMWPGMGGAWLLDYRGYNDPNLFWWGENYTTLCPGLHKPQEAVENYDVAWYKDMDAGTGEWFNTRRIAGAKKDLYLQPFWVDSNTFRVYNEQDPLKHKEVYLLIDYLDRSAEMVDPNDFGLVTDTGFTHPVSSAQLSEDNGQLLLTWILDYQPAWEDILFPTSDYCFLEGNVKDWDVATICIPEPATVTLLVLGGLAAALRRRRHR